MRRSIAPTGGAVGAVVQAAVEVGVELFERRELLGRVRTTAAGRGRRSRLHRPGDTEVAAAAAAAQAAALAECVHAIPVPASSAEIGMVNKTPNF